MAKRSNPAIKIAQKSAHNAMFDAQGKPKPGVHNVLLRAVEVQRPLVLANIRRLQRRNPHATAAQLAATLERDYLIAVTGGGALVGGAAVIPGVGTAAALGLSAAATVGFLEATALFSTSLAELHGVRLVDPEKASTLVMAIMLGEEGTALLSSLSGQAAGQGKGPTQAWGSLFSRRVPLSGFGTVRERIQTMFLRTLLKQQGTALAGPGAAVRHRRRRRRRGQPDDGPRRRRERQGSVRPDAARHSGRTGRPGTGRRPGRPGSRPARPQCRAARTMQRRKAARFGSER